MVGANIAYLSEDFVNLSEEMNAQVTGDTTGYDPLESCLGLVSGTFPYVTGESTLRNVLSSTRIIGLLCSTYVV